MTKSSCAATHKQLLSGVCPWCGLAIEAGRVRVRGGISAFPQRRWNTHSLAQGLEDDNVEVRVTAVNNLWLGAPPLKMALPLLGRALTDRDQRVSRLANSALVMRGLKLLAPEAQGLESVVAVNTNDLAARIVLLVYYSKRAPYLELARSSREQHALWIITHAPQSYIAGMPPFLHSYTECEAYTKAKELWTRQVAANPQDTAVLWNAAAFLRACDWDQCEAILRRGQLLEPEEAKWSEALGRLHTSRMKKGTEESRLEESRAALAQFETSLGTISDELVGPLRLLPLCARAAFECGEFEKARAYAAEALLKASRPDFYWLAGDAIHDGNLILGRLALRDGDREAARRHLIEAGKTPGSPHLKSAGPNMVLAKQLLERGEREPVIEYLKLCGQFWLSIDHQADQWIHVLEHGGVPNFEGYLR